MNEETLRMVYQALLFVAVLTVYCASAYYAFRGITGREPKMSDRTRNILLTAVILETVTVVIGLVKTANFFGSTEVKVRPSSGDPTISDVARVFDPHQSRTNQLAVLRNNPSPDLSGEWEYVCTARGSNYQHGGTCRILVHSNSFGYSLEFNGTRVWRQVWTDKETNRTTLPLAWKSTWGAMTDKDHLQFTYIVETADGVISGYAWGNIQTTNGIGHQFEGNFYQLPPYFPLFGRLEFSRK